MRRRASLAVVALLAVAVGLALWWWASPDGTAPADAVAPAPTRPRTAPPVPRPVADEPVVPELAADPLGSQPTTDDERAALREQLKTDPDIHAGCALDPPLPFGLAHLIVGDPKEIPYDGRLARIALGRVYLPFLPESGEGWLAVEGYAPTRITWTGAGPEAAGTCRPDPIQLEPGDASISGHVRNAEGEPELKVFVEGCGNQARTDLDGYYSMTVRPGPCRVQGFRRDGRLVAPTEVVDVTAKAGEDIVVDLELPPLPRAGLGVAVEAVDEGIRVLQVLPGTAAEDAGLAEGDLITSVDGEPTDELTLQEFVELAVGDVGTDVEIEVLSGGAPPRTLTIERRVIQ